MHFRAEHAFSAPPDAVMAAMVDPDLYRDLELPDVDHPDVLAATSTEQEMSLRLRYTFSGQLDGIARTLLGGSQLTWIQGVSFDPQRGSGELTFSSEDDAHRLHGRANITFSMTGDATERTIDGDLVLAIPLIGATAERRIVSGLLVRLDLEAAAIEGRLKAS